MTSERLAKIRMGEEEEACRIIGIPKENIHWLEFHDGMLEYANPSDLVEEVTKIIRSLPARRRDVDRSWVRSMFAGTKPITAWPPTTPLDAIRAAEWHLYFPNQRLHDGPAALAACPSRRTSMSPPKDANYWVNIDSVVDMKLDAATGACQPVGAVHLASTARIGTRRFAKS